jgi:hypothetical protein
MPSIQVNPRNYLNVQQKIRHAVESAETSKEYTAFNEQFERSIALGRLTSTLSVSELEDLFVTQAGILPPGHIATFVSSGEPRAIEEEGIQAIARRIERAPSAEKQRLELYAEQLDRLKRVFTQPNDQRLAERELAEFSKSLAPLKQHHQKAKTQ